MNEKDIIRSISYIGEDIVSQADSNAENHFKSLKEKRMRYTSIAACFLTIAIISPLMFLIFQSSKSQNGNLSPNETNDLDSLYADNSTLSTFPEVLIDVPAGKHSVELSAGYPNPFKGESGNQTTAVLETTSIISNSTSHAGVTSAKEETSALPSNTDKPIGSENFPASDHPDISEDEFNDILIRFSLNTFRNSIGMKGENCTVSPLSALTCLSMVANGTDGETLSQIETAIGCDIDSINSILLSYAKRLYLENSPLKAANSLWIRNQSGLSVKDSFLRANSYYYGAKIYSAPFSELTLSEINAWCKDSTDGLIDNILNDIDQSDVMILINTLLFKSEWEKEYTEKNIISNFSFSNYDGSTSIVTALESFEDVYISSTKASGFVKSYADSRFAFVLITPFTGVDIYEYVSSLKSDTWKSLWASRQNTTVAVTFPEFSCETDTDLSEIMKKLGINNMFSSEKADFSKLGRLNDGNLFFNLFKQKTALTVDRNGSFVGSGSIGGTNETENIKKVNASNPFIYAIVDSESGTPIFIGCVADLK